MSAQNSDVPVILENEAKIIALKIHKGTRVSPGSLICTYKVDGDKSLRRLKVPHSVSGVVRSVECQENQDLCSNSIVVLITPCQHAVVMKDMCAECGADLRESSFTNQPKVNASVAMVHSIPELVVSEEQALELGSEDERRLLKSQKLVLLVDLDETILHTTNDNIPPNLKDVCHFKLWHGTSEKPQQLWYHTKFRPHAKHFLETISKLYELHICTFGARMYAHTMASFLDPDGKFFSHRILSRQECFDPQSKTGNLKALFPCGESMVCIIDDREEVWNWAPNMIRVKPYVFFDRTADINAPPGAADKSHDDNTSAVEAHRKRKVTVIRKRKNRKDKAAKAEKVAKLEREEETLEESDLKEDGGSSEEKPVLGQSEEGRNNKDNIDLEETAADGSDQSGNNPAKEEYMKDTENSVHLSESEENSDEEYEEIIVWEDNDDYLLHLADILTRIHSVYYEMHTKLSSKPSEETKDERPNLKKIIPYIKQKVLKGVNIVFSGVIPTNQMMKNSMAFHVAKSLGAGVQKDVVSSGPVTERTTHLVSAKLGTQKVRTASRNKDVKVVNIDWLWSCNERWERCDERLFPLDDQSLMLVAKDTVIQRSNKRRSDSDESSSEKRQKIHDGGSMDQIRGSAEDSESVSESPVSLSRQFSETISPLYLISSDELADMGKEIDAEISSDESGEDNQRKDDNAGESAGKEEVGEDEEDAHERKLREQVLGHISENSDSSDDSLSGDFPRGWSKKYRRAPGEKYDDNTHLLELEDPGESNLELLKASRESSHWVFEETTNSSQVPDDEDTDFNDSVGSVDDELAEAVERELFK